MPWALVGTGNIKDGVTGSQDRHSGYKGSTTQAGKRGWVRWAGSGGLGLVCLGAGGGRAPHTAGFGDGGLCICQMLGDVCMAVESKLPIMEMTGAMGAFRRLHAIVAALQEHGSSCVCVEWVWVRCAECV